MIPSTSTSTLGPLRKPAFLAYSVAGMSSNFGWQLHIVGASWLMTTLGGTPAQIALVQTAVALPFMLLSVPGGAISDRIGQRAMVLWAQIFLLVISVYLAASAYYGNLTPNLLLACTFLIGCGRAIYYPGWSSMVSEFLPRSEVPQGVALNALHNNLARSLGPALGGLVVAAVGAFVAFVLNALSHVSVFLTALRWPERVARDDLPPETFGHAIMAGLRYVALSPNLTAYSLRAAVFNFGAVAVLALMPLISRDLLHGGPQLYGFLFGAFGAGAVMAAFFFGALRARIASEPFLALGHGLFAVAMWVLAVSSLVWLSLLAALVAGVAWIFVQSTLYAGFQTASPRWVMSRSIAIYLTFVFGGNALGSMAWGVLAGGSGTRITLTVAAALLAAALALRFCCPVREIDGDGLDPHGGWIKPEPRLDMVPSSGPIVTTIHYRIREDDVAAFLTAMREKRAHRARDGAMRWTLSRDLLDPTLWFERFKVATWAEALRLQSRSTLAYVQVIERVRELHQGTGKPEVHYELVRDPAADPGSHHRFGSQPDV
ncbi:MFS transporter [Antarctobacter sp.]|uniref:MFS transporter n=1 Tax=Antarctobacter sp. TaxID=1872577 RepID=UPI003A8FECCC